MRHRHQQVVALALLCAGPLAASGGAQGVAQEELDLLQGSLRPAGREELEANSGPLREQPLSEVQAELEPKAARISGHLRLLVTNRERAPWAELVLRAYPQAGKGTSLKVFDVQVDGHKARARAMGSVIRIDAALAPGATAAITLSFSGQLRRLRDGEDAPLAATGVLLGQLAPGLLPGARRAAPDQGVATFAVGPLGATLVDWYPQLAARSRGEWDRDEPAALGDVGHADPGSAIVALTVPKGFRVAGAGTALGQHASGEGKETATFAGAGIRGALGLVASQAYEEASDEASGIHLRAVSLHGEAGAHALLTCARTALVALEARFGPYPWSSLTLAEAQLTGGAGGVEMPGLALLAQSLPASVNTGLVPAGLQEFTCYHEVAHQWWQGLVGSDPRRTPWVDEALAQYSALLVEEDKQGAAAGRAAYEQALSTYVALSYHGMRMAQVKDGVVARGADQFHSKLAYAGLIYGKAPLFFDKARALLGDEKFDAATRAYRKAWAFREAGGGAWLAAAQRAAPEHAEELSALQRRWWEEKHGDEDIPPPDGLALMDALGGGGNGFSQLLRSLQQAGGVDPAQLKDALQQLERLMPELTRMLQDGAEEQ